MARGAEMWAYRVGHEAAAAGAIFVVAVAGAPTVESLVNAVLGSLAITLPMSPGEIRAKVAEALAARAADRVAVRPSAPGRAAAPLRQSSTWRIG